LRLFFAGILIGPPWPVGPAESTALPLRGLRVCMPTAAAARHTCLYCAYMVTGAPGRGTGAGACPRGHCRLAACPGDRILRICSRVLGRIYSRRAATPVRRAMRSFVTSTSVPGPRSSPDPVRFCAQYPSSARHVSDSAIFAIQDLPDFYPITGRRLVQSFPLSTAAATAISSIANPRRHPAVNHDPPAVAGRALSARRRGSSSGPAKQLL
jgi:hypothetical protein